MPALAIAFRCEKSSSAPALGRSAGPGFARWTVIDATGAADTVVIRIQQISANRLSQ